MVVFNLNVFILMFFFWIKSVLHDILSHIFCESALYDFKVVSDAYSKHKEV